MTQHFQVSENLVFGAKNVIEWKVLRSYSIQRILYLKRIFVKIRLLYFTKRWIYFLYPVLRSNSIQRILYLVKTEENICANLTFVFHKRCVSYIQGNVCTQPGEKMCSEGFVNKLSANCSPQVESSWIECIQELPRYMPSFSWKYKVYLRPHPNLNEVLKRFELDPDWNSRKFSSIH